MKITEEQIRRIARQVAGTRGGSQMSLDGYATQDWVDKNYVAIEWFDQIFQIFDDETKLEVNGEIPTDTSKMNIQSMFGFWTEFYLTALGNGGHVGDAIYLSSLADVSVAGVADGQVLQWNQSQGQWVAWTPQSGVDMSQVWAALQASTSEQINASHLTTALTGYATTTWVANQGYITAAALTGYATQSWVNTQLANYLPLAGGAMVAGARISSSGGNLYIGNSNNAGWLMLQDVCSQSGSNYWSIAHGGDATFANVYSNGAVTALSDEREKRIIGFEELSVELIAAAPIVRFTWKDSRDENDHLGSIAQYWQPIVPELTPMVNGRLTMDYAAIALLSSISIARKVEDHEERLRELESRIKN